RDFIPADDQSELSISFVAPTGTSVEGVKKIGADIAEHVEKIRGVEFTWVRVATINSSVYVRLIDASKRNYSNQDVAAQIRKEVLVLPQYAGMRSKVLVPSALGSGDNFNPIRALISGPDIYKVADIAVRAMDEVRNIPGLVDVSSNINLNRPEFQIKI